MLLLLLRLGEDRYGLDVRTVREVVPFAALKRLPQAPPYVAGVLNYRGRPVPVIDLPQLTLQQPCAEEITSRIVIAQLQDATLLGVLAEEVTATLRCAEPDLVPSGMRNPDAPYLDGLAADDGRFVQRIALERLLPEELRARLQTQAQGASGAAREVS